MPDREKIITQLESMRDYHRFAGNNITADIADDALTLLKEQESEWVEQVLCYDTDVIWMCGKCKAEYTLIDGTPFENEYFFCPHCGAKMTKEVRVEEEEDE